MIQKKQPEKVWTDKGSEFKGEFNNILKKRTSFIHNRKRNEVSICREETSNAVILN